MKRTILIILVMFVAFSFGIFLGFAAHSAKAMDYDVGQAVELLAMPMDAYEPEPAPPEPVTTYLGTYTVTAYCPCEICCGKWSNPDNPKTASSTTPTELITVGADWDELVPGTTIYIDGVGERIVEDKVAGWVADKYDGKVLDLYYFDHSDALDFGKQKLDVWEVRTCEQGQALD